MQIEKKCKNLNMLYKMIFALLIFNWSIHPSVIYCATQQTNAVRDPRIRHRPIAYPSDQYNGNEQIAALNATTLLQQFPSHRYSWPQHNTPPEVAKYRNLGNYYQVVPLNAPPQAMLAPPVAAFKNEHKRHLEYSTPAHFDHHVLHSIGRGVQDSRPRRYTNASSNTARTQNRPDDTIVPETEAAAMEAQPPILDAHAAFRDNVENGGNPTTIKKTQKYHDIYMRFGEPHQLSFGHVEFEPRKHFEKRFASLSNTNGNRHRGEIVWADATGGYGEHHWDLTQGKLR